MENIDMQHRAHEMFSIFNATNSRENDYGEGFSNVWETPLVDSTTLNTNVNGTNIQSAQSMTVLLKPVSGLARQRQYLPI